MVPKFHDVEIWLPLAGGKADFGLWGTKGGRAIVLIVRVAAGRARGASSKKGVPVGATLRGRLS